MLAHPHRMAGFSAWANARVYAACASLPAAELARDRSAFFRSIVGTLNHILLVDILYRERLEGVRSQFRTLDEVLHSRLDDLTEAQRASDAYYADHTAQLDAPNLDEPIGFYTLLDDPEYWEVAQRIYFSNLFQHQIHHRGQVHNMLSQTGMDPPAVGFIEFEVEHGEHVIRRKG